MGKIRRLTIYSNKIHNSKKILVYSDLHLGFKDCSNIKDIFTYSELSPINYDYILIPGDLVHYGKMLEEKNIEDYILHNLSLLTSNTKTFISIGNHDQYSRLGFERWVPYDKSNIISYFNKLPNIETLDINKKIIEDSIEFSAINNSADYYLNNHESTEAFEKEYNLSLNKMEFSKDNFSILLTHDPKSIYRLSKGKSACFIPKTDLVVSGHMHNGLTPNFIQTKLNGYGFLSPDYTLFPEIAYGIKKVGDTLFLINGAVNSFVEIPILNKLLGFNCTIIELQPKENPKKLTYTYK